MPSEIGREALDGSSKWILDNHDEWTKATLNHFFQLCQKDELTQEQFMRWLVDRVIIARKMTYFLQRLREDLPKEYNLACVDYLKDDYQWFMERIADMRSNTGLNMSYGCQALVELLEKVSGPVRGDSFGAKVTETNWFVTVRSCCSGNECRKWPGCVRHSSMDLPFRGGAGVETRIH